MVETMVSNAVGQNYQEEQMEQRVGEGLPFTRSTMRDILGASHACKVLVR